MDPLNDVDGYGNTNDRTEASAYGRRPVECKGEKRSSEEELLSEISGSRADQGKFLLANMRSLPSSPTTLYQCATLFPSSQQQSRRHLVFLLSMHSACNIQQVYLYLKDNSSSEIPLRSLS